MSYAEAFLPEFDREMASTRKVLECIPDDSLDWKAHPDSRSIGWNASHVADLPAWIVAVLAGSSFDAAPVGGKAYSTPELASSREILETFDRNVAAGRAAIAGVGDQEVGETWSLLRGGNAIFSLPRSTMIRIFVLNHLIHHRAHLCVYLRLNDQPVPGMYEDAP